jgi:radical SAM superfamily enzyme YgiQ (UPF0313 family)
MKSLLFVIPWARKFVNNANYIYAESPERAPENVVGLATYLRIQGCRIDIADMSYMLMQSKGNINVCLEMLWNKCNSFSPDIIGLSFFTARFETAGIIVEFLREKYKNIDAPMIIAGGIHPTLLPEITYQYINFDALMIGEGELSLLSLLNGESPDKIDGVFLKGQKSRTMGRGIKNLDNLPMPDWSFVNKDFYSQPCYFLSYSTKERVMPITFGRGCLYRCNFCAHNSFLGKRCHSPEYFINMMDYTAEQCGINAFIVQDSSVGSFKKEWTKVCELLIAKGSPYRWWGNLRANQVDEDFLRIMKEAGCGKVFFGFESGSPRILERMNKRVTIEQCKEAARLCHKVGLPFYTSYIINYFGEEEEDLILTEELIRETRPTSLAINKFSPIPGSIDFETHQDLILPYMKDIKCWTNLGLLNAPRLFGNMPTERFEYWQSHLLKLKKEINSNEDF